MGLSGFLSYYKSMAAVVDAFNVMFVVLALLAMCALKAVVDDAFG